jgi:nucleoid-associated protein YgaU
VTESELPPETSPADEPELKPQATPRSRRASSPTVATSRRPVRERRLTAKPVREPGVERHRIQPGDTLAGLAQEYYGHEKYVSLLARHNPQITDPHRLRVGTEINIPPRPAEDDKPMSLSGARSEKAAPPADGARRTYTVKSGDSFYAIARNVLGDASRWEEVYALNRDLVHGDPTRLQVGHVVVLPQ